MLLHHLSNECGFGWFCRDTMPIFGSKLWPFLFGSTSILFLGLGKLGKLFIPLPLQVVCYQSVFGPHKHILPLSKLGFLSGSLNTGTTNAVKLSPSISEFLKDLKTPT